MKKKRRDRRKHRSRRRWRRIPVHRFGRRVEASVAWPPRPQPDQASGRPVVADRSLDAARRCIAAALAISRLGKAVTASGCCWPRNAINLVQTSWCGLSVERTGMVARGRRCWRGLAGIGLPTPMAVPEAAPSSGRRRCCSLLMLPVSPATRMCSMSLTAAMALTAASIATVDLHRNTVDVS